MLEAGDREGAAESNTGNHSDFFGKLSNRADRLCAWLDRCRITF